MGIDRRGFLTGTGLTAAAGALLRARTGAAESSRSPMGGEPDWAAVRAEFELSRDFINLGTFFLASHPRPVREAIDKWRHALDRNPLFLEEAMFEPDHERLSDRVKAAVAAYLGGRPEEIALTSNTTTGLALVYNGLRIRPDQEILGTEHDHYSHHESIRLAVEKAGATTRRIALHDGAATASADEMVERLRGAIGPRTRAVGVTWVHSSTGLRLPVRRLAEVVRAANSGRAEAERCLLIVDGVHGLGAVDETVAEQSCDFFVSGTHKWMFGPRGTGIIWGRADAWPQVRPTIPTFDGMEVFAAWEKDAPPSGPTRAAWVSPGGFYAYEHQWAVEEAFHYHERLGRTRIAERIQLLNGRLKEGMAGMPHVVLHTPREATLSAGIVCFDVKGMAPREVVRRLGAKRILATTTPYSVSYARVSAGIMISPEEIETTLREIRALRSA